MRVVILHSGGLDSTVLLYKLVKELRDEVTALHVFYGQRHARELAAARDLCADLSVADQSLDLNALSPLFDSSSLTNQDIPMPIGHYAEPNMKSTVVPNRNMILLSCAIALAINKRAGYVAYAAHSGDHAIYPDCRPEFIWHMNAAAQLADWHPVELYAPFTAMSKADIVTLGQSLGVPFKKTWSCYEGGAKHCGVCGTCVERKEAFQLAGVADPTDYNA